MGLFVPSLPPPHHAGNVVQFRDPLPLRTLRMKGRAVVRDERARVDTPFLNKKKIWLRVGCIYPLDLPHIKRKGKYITCDRWGLHGSCRFYPPFQASTPP